MTSQNRDIIAAILATTAVAFSIPRVHAADAPPAPAATAPAPGTVPATAAPAAPLSDRDAAMQRKVKLALMSDPALHGARIAISTRDGLVTIAGVAVSEKQRARAEEVVASIGGVRKVDNAIEVQGD